MNKAHVPRRLDRRVVHDYSNWLRRTYLLGIQLFLYLADKRCFNQLGELGHATIPINVAADDQTQSCTKVRSPFTNVAKHVVAFV